MPIQKLSKEEIAKQFQLPERKSKIATLLKQDGQSYCICRSSDSSRFMIGCDLCEEWYHGDCIGISQKEAKNIKKYFCERCQEDDPTLRTVYKSSSSSSSSKPLEHEFRREHHHIRGRPKKDSDLHDPVYSPPKKKVAKGPCGYCVNCRKTSNCGSCRACKEIKRGSSRRSKEKCMNRVCVKLGSPSSLPKIRVQESSDEDDQYRSSYKQGMQCYGPGCTETARPTSKYCSERCGIKLATNRIFQVLPQRLQEWSMSQSFAEGVNKKDLEAVRLKQVEAQAALHELDKKYQKLEAIIIAGKNLGPCNAEQNDKEEDASIYCVTCGHEIHTSSAIKHMEKCFNKYESQASFGSMYKTRIEGNSIFCDFYNPSNKTYCKRLRVLCPEHTKDPIPGAHEACGYPLIENVFNETDTLCCYPKKSCLKHYCWEKLRRAEIDMERVRHWLKLDELLEQERQIRQKLVERAGVLGLMLHSTYDHDAMETMTSAQEEERLAQLEKTFKQNYNKELFESIPKENKKFPKSFKRSY